MPEIPFVFEWSIPENKLLALLDTVNGNLLSGRVCNIPEFQYFLKIYPNGNKDQFRGQTWIFLHIVFKNIKKIEATHTFTVESSNRSVSRCNVYEESIGYGCCVCQTDEFFDRDKKYIIDGKFTVKVFGVFKFDIPIGHQKWDGGELGCKLWKKDDTKDFTIATKDGKEIKVHKFILANASDVFAAMFNSNMNEAKENKMEASDFSFYVVETGIKFIYDCNFSTALSLEELMLLLHFFDIYHLPFLKEKVEPYLITQVSSSTVCILTNASIFTNSPKLKKKCFEYLSAAFASKTQLDDFEILDKDVVFEIAQNSFGQIVKTDK